MGSLIRLKRQLQMKENPEEKSLGCISCEIEQVNEAIYNQYLDQKEVTENMMDQNFISQQYFYQYYINVQTELYKNYLESCILLQNTCIPHKVNNPHEVIEKDQDLLNPSLDNSIKMEENQSTHTKKSDLDSQILSNRLQSEIKECKQSASITNLTQTAAADKQKDGRNNNSNVLRMFFRMFEDKIQRQPELLRKIIKREKLRVKVQGFKDWYEFNRINWEKYVGLGACKPLFFRKKDFKAYAKIMRIFLRHFLEKDAVCGFLLSKRVVRSSLPHNLRAIRCVLTDIEKAKGNA